MILIILGYLGGMLFVNITLETAVRTNQQPGCLRHEETKQRMHQDISSALHRRTFLCSSMTGETERSGETM